VQQCSTKVEAIPEKIRRNHPRYETEGLIQNAYMINGRGKKERGRQRNVSSIMHQTKTPTLTEG
jgi:hypothetical protein